MGVSAVFLRPLRGAGVCRHWVISFRHQPAGMQSTCQWVGWGVSGVVGGSSLSAFDYLDFSMDSTLVWIGL